ncbi:MAG: ribonucleoside-diphosphate reductase, adenosylcobalamin-dependent, partial [Mucinivorans sp.]
MKTKTEYTYEEAVAATRQYFKGDDLAATVWVSKYALKDSWGKIFECSPTQMHDRIASELVRIEQKYPNPMSKDEVLELLEDFRYVIPQGGPMTGVGNDLQIASLSNCFVIGHEKPADSYGGIIRIDEEQVQLMKRRGGVGHDLSHIRPTGSPVLNSALTSTGIVPFMERYSNSTREVAQDGRRGALMLSLSIKHPDSERFIEAKIASGKVTGANVSIKIDDEFMEALLSGHTYHQQFPIKAIEGQKSLIEKNIDAKTLWNKIIHNAWKSAEPGVLFWDTIIRESIADCYADKGFMTVSTNPCGEIPLCPYDSCRLVAINLYAYVDNPFTKKAKFDAEKFKSHVRKAMRIMDDIIDLEIEKIDTIIEKISGDP